MSRTSDTSPDRDLRHLHPAWSLVVLAILAELAADGYQPVAVETWRSGDRQAHLVGTGASRVSVSLHQAEDTETGEPAALAVDIIDRRLGWGPESGPFFARLAELAERHGATAGLRWPHLHDGAHIQALPLGAHVPRQGDAAPDLRHLVVNIRG